MAVFVTYLVPTSLLFLPLINVINFLDKFLHACDTYWSLVLTYPTFLIPFVTWLLMGISAPCRLRSKNVPISMGVAAYGHWS